MSSSGTPPTPPTAIHPDPMAWLPTSDTPLGTAAANYAAHGFRVVPLWRIIRIAGKPFRCECGDAECVEGGPSHKHVGKHPFPKAWQKKASDDQDTVRDWWRRHAQRNIGLVMGGAGRLVALDVDGPDGRASLSALETRHGALPATLSSASGRDDGGEHRIFRLPDHLDLARIKNRKFLPGLDVKANNGQIACAPSEHNTGRIYTWTARVEVADMPEWLYEAMCASPVSSTSAAPSTPARPRNQPLTPAATQAATRYVLRALDRVCQDIATTTEGSRNEKLFAKACTVLEYFHGEQMNHAEAIDELTAAGMSCGLSKGEVHKVLSNAWDRAKQGPGKRVPALVPKPQLPQGDASAGGGAGAQPEDASAPDGYPADWQEADGHSTNPDDPDTTEPLAWQGVLKRNGEGRIKGCEYNAALILRHDSRFKGHIAFDEFSMRALYKGAPFSDANEVGILIAMQEYYSVDFCASHVNAALKVVTDENRVDTLKMAFDALPTWDGVKRIDSWLRDFLHVRCTTERSFSFMRTSSRKWLIQAVARVYQPGCEAHAALVLIGLQSARKSTATKILGGPFFTDQVANINDEQKCALSLHGKHVVELAEMAAFNGVSQSRIKQWLTQRDDHYTPKYIRHAVTVPRRCVFICTTNNFHPLSDSTGGRRFWPFRVAAADYEGLAEVMPQLWAEAVAAYRAGEQWWLTTEEEEIAAEVQEAARVVDIWEELIEDYVNSEGHSEPTMKQIATEALGLEKGKLDPRGQSKVAQILAKLGFEPDRKNVSVKVGGVLKESKIRCYKKIDRTIEASQWSVNGPANSSEVSKDLSTRTTQTINNKSLQKLTPAGEHSVVSQSEEVLPSGKVFLEGPSMVQRDQWQDNQATTSVYARTIDGPLTDHWGGLSGLSGPESPKSEQSAPFADWVDAELGEGDPKT